MSLAEKISPFLKFAAAVMPSKYGNMVKSADEAFVEPLIAKKEEGEAPEISQEKQKIAEEVQERLDYGKEAAKYASLAALQAMFERTNLFKAKDPETEKEVEHRFLELFEEHFGQGYDIALDLIVKKKKEQD